MRDGNFFRVRGRDISRVEGLSGAIFGFAGVLGVFPLFVCGALLVACGKSSAPPASGATSAPATQAAAAGPAGSRCPATGKWAECSVMYRLERAGLAPHVDSTATPAEKSLAGRPLVVKIGLASSLELYVYPDSTARIADAKKLDRAQFVGPGAAQTINRERLLIETANLIGLLTSLNEHQRERVSDALLAGPPQASTP